MRYLDIIKDGRIYLLLIPALAVLSTDLSLLLSILFVSSAALIIAVFVHLIRKILIKDADMGDAAELAMTEPLGSAIVHAGVSVMLGLMFIGMAIWLSGGGHGG
jgi:predicted DNA repair protein MutK